MTSGVENICISKTLKNEAASFHSNTNHLVVISLLIPKLQSISLFLAFFWWYLLYAWVYLLILQWHNQEYQFQLEEKELSLHLSKIKVTYDNASLVLPLLKLEIAMNMDNCLVSNHQFHFYSYLLNQVCESSLINVFQ